MLEVKGLLKKYDKGLVALRKVSLTIGPGEIIGLMGENGAGKTTFMKSIFNYIPVNAGEILLDGEPITYKNISRLSFATCEHSFFSSMTPEDHRVFYESQFPNFKRKRFDALMEFFELPKNRKLKHFSTGQKNQFEVILALSQGADYIFMDEPFAGNDIFNRSDFYKVLLGILEPQETIILSTHLIEEVQNFISRVVLLKKGAIVGDCTVETLEEEGKSVVDWMKEVYQYDAKRVWKAIEQEKLS